MKTVLPWLKIVLLILFLFLNTQTVYGTEPFWKEYRINVSGVTDEQILILEETVHQLESLEPGELRISPKVYQRLSRFEELFGFPFNGRDLAYWLLSHIRKITYRNTWTAAINQNHGEFMLGDVFFKKLNALERLYLLIHEARHSDEAGYPHIKCPKGFRFVSATQPGMDLQDELACDKSDKGGYAFQAAFLFELFAYGIFDQQEIGLLYNSSICRIIP